MAGPGRFALGCRFQLVTDFFQDSSLPPGTYSKTALAARYGLSFFGLAFQEGNVDDGKGDYAERTFVWGSVAFQISNSAQFVVDANGTKHIDNFSVEPLVANGIATDNFDFSSSNPLTQLGDSLILQPNLDPSEIGRAVTILFTGQLPTVTYTEAKYNADLATAFSWTNPSLLTLYTATSGVMDALWNSGAVKFLDSTSRPIVYGTTGDDVLDQEPAANDAYLRSYLPNGVVYVGAGGNDTFEDTLGPDVMLGGVGRDTADFSGGNGLKLTIDSGTYSGGAAPLPVVSVQIDGRSGPDLLSSTEIIKLTAGADTVSIATTANLTSIQTIDAGGQGVFAQDVLDLSQSNATVSIIGSTVDVNGTAFKNFEKLILSSGADTVKVTSLGGLEEIDGAGGNDTIDFTDSKTAIDPIDFVVSYSGTLLKNFENVIGTNLADTFTFSSTAALMGVQSIDAAGQAAGTKDTLDFSNFSDTGGVKISANMITATSTRVTNFEKIIGSSGNDDIDFQGASSDLEIHGGSGDDTIRTGNGNDTLEGGGDRDVLQGGGGFDTYLAGSGDSILDQDGRGTVIAAGGALTGGQRVGSAGAFTNSNGDKYLWDGAGSDLRIFTHLGERITVEHFQNGSLGINLKQIEKPKPFPPGPFISPPVSPLALDLDGNGIELSSTASGVHFGFDGGNYKAATGWLNPNDGFLVYDANQNGGIDNGTELFGSSTANGFDILSFYDGRSGGNYYTDPSGGAIDYSQVNGVIDANDPIYNHLQVWRDLNQDGVSQANELMSLADAGITQINLSFHAPDADTELNAELSGNQIRQVGSFGKQDGSSSTIADVWFAVDNSDTVYVGPSVPNLADWPDLHGFGSLNQLHNVLAGDADLQAAFRSFIDGVQTESLASLVSQFEELMYRWAGIPDNYSVDRGEYVNARELAFLEKAYGQTYLQRAGLNEGTTSPGPYAAALLRSTFNNAIASYLVKFVAQIPAFTETLGNADGQTYASRFAPLAAALHYDASDDSLRLDAAALATSLSTLDMTDQAAVANAMDIFGLLTIVQSYDKTSDADFFGQLRTALLANGASQLIPLIDSFRIADSGSVIKGESPDGIYAENVVLLDYNREGQYTIVTPNSTVYHRQTAAQSYAADIYYVQAGSGTITFESTGGPTAYNAMHERIVLSTAFNDAPYTLERNAQSGEVRLVFSSLSTTLVLKTYFDNTRSLPVDWRDPTAIDSAQPIYFENGTVLSVSDVANLLARGTEGDDSLQAVWLDHTVDGKGGDDVIIGDGSGVTMIGGTGNDQMSGNGLQGVFIFNRGDGNDTISQSHGTTLQLAGIAPGDIHLARSGASNNDLLITFPGQAGDSITVLDELGSQSVAKIQFGDGTIWSFDDIASHLILQSATDGNDVIVGSDGSDVLAGGRGDDVLQGAPSAFSAGDTFLYQRGDGNDTIIPNYVYSLDTLKLFGIRADQTTVTRSGDNAVLSFDVPEGGSITLFDQFGPYGTFGLERIEFSDGMVWTEADIAKAMAPPMNTPTIVGTSGDDVIVGTDGADGIAGLAGDDVLKGGSGSDTYFFGIGSGHDVIDDAGSNDFHDADTAKLGVTPSEVFLTRAGTDVVVTIRATGETLTLKNFFVLSFANSHQSETSVEYLEFADGTVWNAAQVTANAWIRGGGGDETLTGTRDADTLVGGPGNDVLDGGEGDDTYIIAQGDGTDTITELSYLTGYDVVNFVDSGIDDVVFRARMVRTPGDWFEELTVARKDGSASVIFNAGIDELRFSDGTVLSLQQVIDRTPFVGTDAADTIEGNLANNTLVGGKGDDQLFGASGSDTYVWSRGDGNDVIVDYYDSASADTLHISGVNPALVQLERVTRIGQPSYDLVVRILPLLTGDALEAITVTDEFAPGTQGGTGIEYIAFDDGTVWNRSQIDAAAAMPFSWQPGDGSPTIIAGPNSGTKADTLKLHGVSVADITLTRVGQNLLITDTATGEVINVSGQMSGNGQGIARIVFDNGLVWDRAQIVAQAVFVGTAGQDFIGGSPGDDRINGGGGDDYLYGEAGSDTYIYARGDGNDHIYDGGTGVNERDTLKLTDLVASDVSLSVDFDGNMMVEILPTGEQIIVSGEFAQHPPSTGGGAPGIGIDVISFADGQAWNREQIEAAISVISGTDGSDMLQGSIQADLILGNAGDDTIRGGLGNDFLRGGAGSDAYDWSVGDGSDTISDAGESGDIDTLGLHGVQSDQVTMISNLGSADITVDVGGEQITLKDQQAGDTARALERIVFDDGTVWTASDISSRLTIIGTDNTDYIFGSGTDDHIFSRGGSDTIFERGGSGHSTIDGGGDYDRVVFQNVATPILVNLALGIASGPGIATTMLTSIEAVQTDAGDDTLIGADGGNWLFAGDGNDLVEGGDGDDILQGGAGNDVLAGGAGNNDLEGGDGIDAASYASAIAGVTVNLAVTTAQNTVGAGTDTLISIENLIGSSYNDLLTGNGGDNALSGGGGDDTLDGGGGADTLSGGAGHDTFVFLAPFGDDVITDFNIGDDVLSIGSNLFADRNAVLSAATEIGSDVVIDAGAFGTIRLTGLTLADLASAVVVIVPQVRDAPDILKPATIVNTSTSSAVMVPASAFDLLANEEIGSSTTIPHATIRATTSGYGKEYYAVQLVANDQVTFDIDHGTFDSVIQLFDSNMTSVAFNDDSAGDPGSLSYNSLISYTVSQTGIYYLAVGSYGGNNIPPAGLSYVLHVSAHPAIVGSPGNDVLTAGVGDSILVGNGGYDSYQVGLGFGKVAIDNSASDGLSTPGGEVDFGPGIGASDLWLKQNGNDLEIDLLGTTNRVTIDGWFGGNGRAQVQSFSTSDGLKLDSQISQLVQAMATYSANNAGFDPTSSSIHTIPNDASLQNAVAAAWHA